MIYFDFDKSDIRIEAALDLEKILDVMNQYPIYET
jgi:outer membrane protein OmpA-like peptidoglycan-associated protein